MSFSIWTAVSPLLPTFVCWQLCIENSILQWRGNAQSSIKCGISPPVKVWNLNRLPSEQSQAFLEFKVTGNLAEILKICFNCFKDHIFKDIHGYVSKFKRTKVCIFPFTHDPAIQFSFLDTPILQVICEMLPKLFSAYRKHIISTIGHNIIWNLHFSLKNILKIVP